LVNSLARPGGNTTGFTAFETRHRREMAGTGDAGGRVSQSGDAMASKRKGRKRTTSMSGLATILLREKTVPFDTPQSQKNSES
jgi:hypothetical protein